MAGNRMAVWAILLGTLGLTGCCRWCDRWCPERAAHAYPPVAAAPQCCVPATVCCPPGTVPASGYSPGFAPTAAPPAGQPWQRSYSAVPGGQPNCCE